MNKKFVLVLLSVLHICILALAVIVIYSSTDISGKDSYAAAEKEEIKQTEIEITETEETEEETEIEETEIEETEIEESESVPESEIETETVMETQTTEEETETETVLYTFVYSNGTRNLNIRKGPSIEYEIIGKIPKNGVGSVIEFENDNWALVEYNGIKGYCSMAWSSVE
jgi:uncharacterized protein YgiM (DUF1202 family)